MPPADCDADDADAGQHALIVRARWIAGAVVLALGVAGGLAAWTAASGGSTSSGSTSIVPTGTVVVERRDLVSTRALAGSLASDSAPAPIDRLAGTYTALPATGTLLGPGVIAWEVDGEPVVVMAGLRPAWRPFAPGMSDGPDVSQLEAGLVASGDAHGLIGRPDDHFDAGTEAAVRRWQARCGLPVTGMIELGRIAFLPQALLVGAHRADPGDVAEPGSAPYDVTGTGRAAVATLDASDPITASAGEAVSVELPDGSKVGGHVLSIGPRPGGAPSGGSGASDGTSGSGSGDTDAASTLTARVDGAALAALRDQTPVSILVTVGDQRDVLAVPVDALVAMTPDRSGVEVAVGGRHVLRAVGTGVFAGGYVEITSGLEAGDRVVVPR